MSPDRLVLEGLGEKLKLTVVSASGLPSGYVSMSKDVLHFPCFAHDFLWPARVSGASFFVRLTVVGWREGGNFHSCSTKFHHLALLSPTN